MLYETCFLAKELIAWKSATQNGKSEELDLKKLKFKTNDPAPPFNIQANIEQHQNFQFLQNMLLNLQIKILNIKLVADAG